MKMPFLTYLWFLFFAIFVEVDGRIAYAQLTSETKNHVGVIAEASLANRDSLRPFSMRFRYSKGEAKNLQWAEKGRFRVPPTVADCGLWEDAGRRRFERIARDEFDISKELQGQGRGTISVPFHSRKIIEFQGELKASYSAGLKCLVIRPDSDSRIGISGTPFDAGVMGKRETGHPARKLIRAIEAESDVQFYGEVEIGGDLLLHVALNSSGYICSIYFDPNRGFLPVRMEYRRIAGDSIAFRLLVVGIEEVGGSFFPTRVRRVAVSPSGEMEACTLEEWVVTDYQVHTPVPDSEFAIEIPNGVRIHNGVNPHGQFGLKQGRSINLEALRELSQIAAEDNFAKLKASRRILTSAQQNSTNRASDSPFHAHPLLIGNVIFIATCVALWFMRRRRKNIVKP